MDQNKARSLLANLRKVAEERNRQVQVQQVPIPPSQQVHPVPPVPAQVPPSNSTTTTSSDRLSRLKERFSKLQNMQVPEQPPVPVPPQPTPAQQQPQPQQPPVPATTRAEVQVRLPDAIARTLVSKIEDTTGTAPTLSKHQVGFSDLNEKQKQAVRLASAGESFVLIGGAGSGKTTTVRVMAQVLEEGGTIGVLTADQATKVLAEGMPALAIVSFTNQAVTNIKEAVPERFKPNCTTAHKLLEYSPVFYELENAEGKVYKTMRYEPVRTAGNPIPKLDLLIIEEAGTVNLDLYDRLMSALPNKVTTILLGDLNQVPPVFGDAILGYKLLELPVVELTTTYRQETDSPIKKLALRILEGRSISDKELREKFHTPQELELVPFKVAKEWQGAVDDCGNHFASLVRNYFKNLHAGTVPENRLDCFNYERDVLLIPYNMQLGTTALNRFIAEEVTRNLGVPTFEILGKYKKFYYAVGDIVFHNKNKWRIVDIKPNSSYVGVTPQPPSITLNRLGIDSNAGNVSSGMHIEDMERIFEGKQDEDGDSSNACSHIIVLEDIAQELADVSISSIGDIEKIYLGYALSVHKSQGSEWEQVFCLFHTSHVNLCREILYTAITRARKRLRIYYSGENPLRPTTSTFQKGIMTQKIPGNTLADKLKYFRSKLQAEATKREIELAKKQSRAPDIAAVLGKGDAVLATEMLQAITAKNNLVHGNE